MSIIANDVDTRMVSLRLSDTRSNNTTHTLKAKLLKDTSKYSCIVKNVYTDSIPPLLSDTTVLFAILHKSEIDAPFPYTVGGLLDTEIVAPYDVFNKCILQREHHWNILQVIQYISNSWMNTITESLLTDSTLVMATTQYTL